MIAKAGKDTPGAFGCLPTARQQLLLRAAAAPLEIARPAWQQWRAGADLGAVDSASRRLLLWIFHRREELRLAHADAAALEPNYRAVWLRNQVLLNRAAEVVRALQAAGIECLLLKGIALLSQVYADEGGRYLEDFDILVRPEHADQTIAELTVLGWRPLAPDWLSVENSPSHGFANADGICCDLQWRVFWKNLQRDRMDEDGLWATKRPLMIRGESAFILSTEHLLLHLFVHGMSWQAVPPIRWILDANLLILKHKVDWAIVLSEACRRRITLPTFEALTIYNTIFPSQIPASIVERLCQFPVNKEDRQTYARYVNEQTLISGVSQIISDWRAEQKDGQAPPGWSGVVRYLCRRWRVQSAWKLPTQLAMRFRRRWRAGERFFGVRR